MIRILFFVLVVIAVVQLVRRIVAAAKPQVFATQEGLAVRVQRTISLLSWQEIC